MTDDPILTRRGFLASAGVAGLALAGCGSDSDAPSSKPAAGDGDFPTQVAHKFGTTTVENAPGRRRPLNQGYRDFLRLVAGQVSSAIADARAYEEERRTAKALAELDQAKSTFFSNVSHELRTPLTLVLGPLEELLRAGEWSPERRELLSVAHRNGQRLLKLVNTLLEVSRLEAGRVRAAYEPVNLAAHTADVASTFRSTMEKAELRFVVACEPLPEPAFVDAEMWEKVVLNLLSNAFKFTLRGEVHVGLRAEAGRAVLTVQDTGTGIPAEALPRLFDRFFRLEGGRGRTSEGTGIGLALVHELVRLHGGTIEVESHLGAGSTFTVAIPLGRAHLPGDQVREEGEASAIAVRAHPYVEEALRWLPDADLAPERALGQAPSRADGDEAVGGRERIPAGLPRVLVADDNADMRGYLCRLLGTRHEVATVANGEEALREAARQVPDLVLADVMMPELDGFALLKALRSDPRTAAVPVILLSARAGEEARIEGLEAGAEDYLVKPFGARELLARVSGTLALAEQRRAARRREDDLRRAHEAELQRSHAELETIYSSTPVGLCLLDRELRYVRVNETLARMNGLPAAQHIGRTVRETVPHLADQVEPAFRRVLETGVPLLDVELVGSTVGEPGVERTWLESWYPQRDGRGEVVGVNVVAMEITERKRAESALKEGDARKDEFLATLAHELRNPLAPIRNALGVLRLSGGSAEGTRLVEMMERQVHQMVRLVDDLLDVSRINRGSIELRRRSVGLGAIVDSAIETSRPLLEAGGHRLSVELPREPIVLNADAERLSQVLSNILNNAAKYTEVPGHIQLEVLGQGTEAVVSVRDDGRGIKAELLPRIFDMFTGANRDAGRSGGLGIGLALARKIVEMHAGRIEALSEGPGRGTELRVTLPVAAAAADELPKRERERGRSLRGLRVLVVDDNRDSAESLGMILELHGAQVAVSYDGPSALSSFSETAPSIVLLDLGMPGMDGFEVARRIRQQDGRSAVTLIALSGWGQEDDRRRTRAEGFDHHLVKPVDPDTLLRLLGPRSSPQA